MNYKFKLVFLLYIIFYLSAVANCAPATTPADFLSMNIGGKSSAMGGAYTGKSGDIESVFYNPAGMILSKKYNLMFYYNSYLMDMYLGSINLAGIYKDYFLAASISYFNKGNFIRTTFSDKTGASSGTFTSTDFSILLNGSSSISEKIRFGTNIKIFKLNIDSYSIFGGAFDIGFLFWKFIKNKDLSMGLSIQNIGPPVKFIRDSYNLPVTGKAGISYGFNYEKIDIKTNIDFNKPLGGDFYYNAGIELAYKIAVRLGYNSSKGAGANITAGLGVQIKNIDFDYTFLPYAMLGNTHQFSMGFRF